MVQKSKKNFKVYIVAMVCIIALFLCCNKKEIFAKEISANNNDVLQLNNVEVGIDQSTPGWENIAENGKVSVEKPNNIDNVYLAQYNYGVGRIKTIDFKGALIDDKAEISVEAENEVGALKKYTVGEQPEIIKNGKSYNIKYNYHSTAGVNYAILKVKVSYENKNYEYIFAFVGDANANNDILLKDVNNNNILTDGMITSNNSKTIQALRVSENTKEISVECLRESSKNDTYSPSIVKEWMSDGLNYVRINNGEYTRLNGSGDRQGENWSGNLALKKGLNIVDVSVERVNTGYVTNKGNTRIKEGLMLKSAELNSDNQHYSYIIYRDGGEDEITSKNSDTSLKYVEATQLGDRKVAMASYPVKQENDEYTIALPLQLPKSGTTVYNKIILGLIPTDGGATVEILDDDATNYTACGDWIGMYHAAKVTNADGSVKDSIKVRVTASDGTQKDYKMHLLQTSSDASVNEITFKNASLKTCNGKEEVGEDTSFTSDKKIYQYISSGNVSMNIVSAEGTKVYVNDKLVTPDAEGNYSMDTTEMVNIVKVVAADGITNNKYYFIKENEDGTVPLFAKSETEISKAKEMLTAWNDKRTVDEKKNLVHRGYWEVYMSRATNSDMRGATVYDISTHSFTQGTDWGACILELVMAGENPYNYKGVNYVEGLKKCKDANGNYGPFASNCWALMAFKACGEPIEDSLLKSVLQSAKANSQGDDIRAWCVSAVSDEIPFEEFLPIALSLKETQTENGVWGNAYTNGCYATAIASTGVNLEYYSTDKGSFLDQFKKLYMDSNGMFQFNGSTTYNDRYCKDAIIGLGDIVNQRSVWASYRLTQEKLKALIANAERLDTSNATAEEKEELNKAINAAKEVQDKESGFGNEYFVLYKAMANVSEEYNEHLKFCDSYDTGKAIDEVNEEINNLGDKVALKDADKIFDLKKKYESIKEEYRFYVADADKLVKASEEIKKLQVDDICDRINNLKKEITIKDKKEIESIRKAYNSLDEEQKKLVKNIDVLANAEKAIKELENSNEDVQPVPDKNINVNKLEVKFKSTTKQIKLTWNAISKANGYQVSLYNTKTKKYKVIANVSKGKTSYTIKSFRNKKLSSATKYRVMVKAYVVQSKKKVTIKSEKIIASTAPEKVVLRKTTTVAGKRVRLRWNKIKGSNGYQIWVKSSPKGKYILEKKINGVNKISFTTKKLKNGKYFFKIRAYKTIKNVKVYGKYSKPKVIRIK